MTTHTLTETTGLEAQMTDLSTCASLRLRGQRTADDHHGAAPGGALLTAVLSGIVVNARLLLYGAALEPWFRHQPAWFRLIGAQLIQDQTYLLASARTTYSPAEFRRYWGWHGCVLLSVWTGSVVVGLLAAPVLPPLPHLGVVGATLFVAMLVPRLVIAALAASATALGVAHSMPNLGILAGTAAGVASALSVRRWSK